MKSEIIAHDGRRVCSENSSLYKAIINTEGVISKLMLEDPVSNEILHDFELTEEFCIKAIETIRNFLFLLDAKIPIPNEHVS